MSNITVLSTTLAVVLTALGTADAASAQKVAEAQQQTIWRAGAQPSTQGPEQYFSSKVRVDPLFPANETAQYMGGSVTFEPGARSAWHVHPAGQHLIVTAGVGRTGVWGGPVVEIKAGDVLWCPPGVKHWHGAASNASMTHIALTGVKDGKNVDWLEKVSDEQYAR